MAVVQGQLRQHPGYEGIGWIGVEEFSGPILLEGILAQGKWARPQTPVTGQPMVVVGSEHVQPRLDAQGTPWGPEHRHGDGVVVWPSVHMAQSVRQLV